MREEELKLFIDKIEDGIKDSDIGRVISQSELDDLIAEWYFPQR